MDDSFEGDEFSLAEREILMMKARDHKEACLTLKAESDQAVKERDQMQAECNQMQAARDQAMKERVNQMQAERNQMQAARDRAMKERVNQIQAERDQERINGLTAPTASSDRTMMENFPSVVRQDTTPPSPTSDDNQSSAATPVEDAVTPDITGAKRKATTSVEGQPRQGKAARGLASTFGDQKADGTAAYAVPAALIAPPGAIESEIDTTPGTDAASSVPAEMHDVGVKKLDTTGAAPGKQKMASSRVDAAASTDRGAGSVKANTDAKTKAKDKIKKVSGVRCDHNRRKDSCGQCNPGLRCEHKSRRRDCRICNPSSHCQHFGRAFKSGAKPMFKKSCRTCSPHFFCQEGCVDKSGQSMRLDKCPHKRRIATKRAPAPAAPE
jgi:hypothetical protein